MYQVVVWEGGVEVVVDECERLTEALEQRNLLRSLFPMSIHITHIFVRNSEPNSEGNMDTWGFRKEFRW